MISRYHDHLSWKYGEDAAQETWVKVAKNASRYDASKGTVKTWLYVIADRTAKDHARSMRPTVALGDHDPSETFDHVERLDIQAVRAALPRLPEPLRAAVALVTLAEMTYRDAATMLGVSGTMVWHRHQRGLAALRDLLRAA